MIFANVKELLDSVHMLLQDFECRSASTIQVLNIGGLSVLSRECQTYDKHISHCERYFDHFKRNLSSLESLLYQESHGKKVKSGLVEDFLFELFEDLALFIREKVLRTGFRGIHAEEDAILNYFDSCDEWLPWDGKMVSQSFYISIPVSVFGSYVTEFGASVTAPLHLSEYPSHDPQNN